MWPVATISALSLFAGCRDTPVATPPNTAILSVPEIVELTGLPEQLSVVPTLPPPVSFEPLPTSSTSSTSLPVPPTVPYELADGEVAEAVDGNRILMIGDSILASTAPRFGGPMCATVESYGWAVQIEAETSRHIEFAEQVLDELIPVVAASETTDDTRNDTGDGSGGEPPFDVVMIMLGNNYRGDIEDFTTKYDVVLRRLSPLPVVVYTVTEDEPSKAEVNDAIRDLADEYDNVIVIDWAEKSGADPDELLAGDDLHLSNTGRDRLSLFTVAALGKTTIDAPGCLDPVFTDDSG